MKELSIEQKAQRYDEALTKARNIVNSINVGLIGKDSFEAVFPELKESEDEKIRKELIRAFKSLNTIKIWNGIERTDILAWLEKQGSEPNWCHHKVDLSNCSEEYRKAYYDGWNNCNMQHSQCKSESNDVVKCLINGMKFYYEDNEESTWGTEKFSMKVKDILSWLEKQGGQKDILEDAILDSNEDGLIAETIRYKKEKQGEQKSADKIEPIEWSGKIKSRNVKGVLKEMLDKKLKSADKVEPKFKVGDFIADYYCRGRVVELTDDSYLLDTGQGIPFSCEYNAHLWTIKDAKDGDVLCCENGWTCIFKALDNHKNTFSSYCFMDSDKWFCNTGSECHTLDERFIKAYNGEISPATKEQRNTLMKAIADAGYTFDFEKKELKKIEHDIRLTEFEDALKDMMNDYRDAIGDNDVTIEEVKNHAAYMLSLIHQKHAWSEEDETALGDALWCCKQAASIAKDENDMGNVWYAEYWLKSLKDRVQPKQEWSEKDEGFWDLLLAIFTNEHPNGVFATNNIPIFDGNWVTSTKIIAWLKSIKERYSWKPSEEQMLAINTAINVLGKGTFNGKQLIELREELKKLREE